jgi:hypothetical protein
VVDSNPPIGLGEQDPVPMANIGGRRYVLQILSKNAHDSVTYLDTLLSEDVP